MKRPIKVIVMLSLVILALAGAFIAQRQWCLQQLQTPIFEDGDLAGNPDRIIAKLGRPKKMLRTQASSLLKDEPLRVLFRSADLARLDDREVIALIWEQDCLGSTIWRLAVVTDVESERILVVGGESSYYAPVFLGGGRSG